ncbi:hypothetical protein [Streptomyces sp. NPDC002287]
MLLATQGPGGITTTICNTTGLNDCPTAQWDALSPKAMEKQYGLVGFDRQNGQRWWVMDRAVITDVRDLQSFGGVTARDVGTTTQARTSGPSAYEPLTVTRSTQHAARSTQHAARSTQWFYDAGSLVYELVAPDGKTYAMQSYAHTD